MPKQKKPVQVYAGDGKCPICGGNGIVLRTRSKKPGEPDTIPCTCPAGLATIKAKIMITGLIETKLIIIEEDAPDET